MDIDDKPVDSIRESARNALRIQRRALKDEQTDSRRFTKNAQESVVDIANKLKTKSHISASDLRTLKNSLMDSEKNIGIVLNTQGALRGLVRELSGAVDMNSCPSDIAVVYRGHEFMSTNPALHFCVYYYGHSVTNQTEAAGCLCNLALGDKRACMAIAKAAGPYLVASLDNLIPDFVTICAWCLGNLASGGGKVCDLLTVHGAVDRLGSLLDSPNTGAVNAAVYALTHFSFTLGDDLRQEHLRKILQASSKLDLSVTSELLFILSCHERFSPEWFTGDFYLRLFNYQTTLIEPHLDSCTNKQPCCDLGFLFRIIANINESDVYSLAETHLMCKLDDSCIERLVKKGGGVKESLLWFLGNMYTGNHTDMDVF